jgi:hypothetical protein
VVFSEVEMIPFTVLVAASSFSATPSQSVQQNLHKKEALVARPDGVDTANQILEAGAKVDTLIVEVAERHAVPGEIYIRAQGKVASSRLKERYQRTV